MSAIDRLTVIAPRQVEAGETFTVRLWLEGSGSVQALSAALAWEATVAEPLGVDAGVWLEELGGVAMTPRPGVADLALLGMGGSRLAGEGEVAVVRFRARIAGEPGVEVAKLLARDAANRPVEVAIGTRVADAPKPTETALEAAYPNPFRGLATIGFRMAEAGPVTVTVYGVDGRAVRTLADEWRDAGTYRLDWDGRDDHGIAAAAGVYYVRMATPGRRLTRAITYLR